MAKIKVFVVDDSALMRETMTAILSEDRGIEVLGAAPDPLFALRRMQACWPDVITLDIEMPRMDGITFLRKLMAERPTPVVICSTLAEQGAEVTLAALTAGAVEVITKPKLGLKGFLHDSRTQILDAVKAAAAARLDRAPAAAPPAQPKLTADAVLPGAAARIVGRTTDHVVAIGTSTGGTQALERVFVRLPRTAPGIVVVQHMPEQFTRAFAERLDRLCEVQVKEAQTGDRVLPGHVLVAPGGRHLLLTTSGAQYRVEVRDGPLVSRHRPSVDVLFRSVARAAGPNALGVIMTGMGDDGARGLAEMHAAGARTIAQDEASCVVYGMPKEAVKRNAVDEVLPLERIAEAIMGERARHEGGDGPRRRA